jgi:DNA polymerase-3 subunit alpha
MEAVAFPDVYRKFSAVLGQGNLAVIEGKAEERGGELQFIIQRADLLTDWLKSHASSQTVLYLKIIKEMEKPAFLQELKQLLGKYKGNTPVVLYYGSSKTTVRLPKESFVAPGTVFIDLLKDLLGEGNVILRD